MPGITITRYNPNDRVVNEAGDKERKQRQNTIAKFWRYYDGDHDQPLKVRMGERNDNIILNLCGRAVDKSVEFIGTPEEFDVTADMAGGENESDPIEIALDELYAATKEDVPEIVQSSLITGHAYVKLYIDRDNRSAMTLLDPRYMTVFWDAMNVKQALFYRLQWQQGDKAFMQDIVPSWLLDTVDAENLYQKPIATYWMIFDYEQAGGSEWKPIRNQRHDYEFAPLVEWALKRKPHAYYGVSFLHSAIPLNDSVNFIASNTGRIIKHHAHPKTFVFGAEVGDENAVGGIWDNLPTDARVETLELQSDLKSSMGMLDLLKGEFFAAQRVLDTATVRDKLGQVTNFGVRMLFSDMLEMTEEARKSIGSGLAEVYRRMLLMNGVNVQAKPMPKWGDPLPASRLETLQAAALEKSLETTSMTTLTEEIGRDPEIEAERKATEGASATDLLTNMLSTAGNRGLFAA